MASTLIVVRSNSTTARCIETTQFREEAEAWIRRAISIAISRDASSGGVIRLVTIHEKGAEKQMFEPAQHPLAYDELPVIRREELVA